MEDFFTTWTMREGVLNDDKLHIANEGSKFKGGYVAILEYYTYATHWSNHKHYKRFKTLDTMYRYIDKHYTDEDTDYIAQGGEIWQN